MLNEFEAVSITDFRSVRGTISVPLDAQIVLIQGVNGAGKSTVMSALELAMTGRVSDISKADQRHLVNHGGSAATVELVGAGKQSKVTLSGAGELHGDPVLSTSDSQFLSERCYLRQRTLGRLLEQYEESANGADSSLTRFVKDLLGLDGLDALIDGLDPAADVRRLRKVVPEYRELEDAHTQAGEACANKDDDLQRAEEVVAGARARLFGVLETLHAPATLRLEPDDVSDWLETQAEGQSLGALIEARQELSAMRERLQKAEPPAPGIDPDALRSLAVSARMAANDWWRSTGSELEALLNELREWFPDLPAVVAGDPATANAGALGRVDAEISRISSSISADESAVAEQSIIDAEILMAEGRLTAIDEQLAGLNTPTDVEELAKALTAVMPLVHDDNCPVCGRAFDEVSDEPLAAHLSAQISELGKAAAWMQKLSKARLGALRDLQNLERKHAELVVKRQAPEAAAQERSTLERLQAIRKKLHALSSRIDEGATTIRRAVEAEGDLHGAEASDRVVTEVRVAAEKIGLTIQHTVDGVKSAAEMVAELESSVDERVSVIRQRDSLRASAQQLVDELSDLTIKQSSLHRAAESAHSDFTRLEKRLNEANRRHGILKNVRREAESARAALVRQVFNQSLNRLWRDLFVRLAPNEPFVPQLCVPEGRRTNVVLETVHRDGNRFGAPGIMLSAGNLNTAALTLFLALHLTVDQRLPWLLLDDPVQSMDEVHVTQLAAFLRTLAREHARQIVIAVHERQLFDYLALELGPGSDNESLVTVELSRSQEATTVAKSHHHVFVPDPVFAAA